MQVRQDVAGCSRLQPPGLFLEVFSCYPLAVLPPARRFLLGRCWIAQVCGAGAAAPWGLELPGPYLEPPLETQPALDAA